MNHRLKTLPLMLALALSFGVATAQTAGSSTSTTPATGSSATGGRSAPAAQPGTGTRQVESRKDDKVARADRKFMQDAAGGGMFEVEVGKLASSKASSPDAKQFADRLVQDHGKANDELVQLANSKHVELPAAPPHGKRRDIAKLGKLSGKEFDQHFAKLGVKDHQEDIRKFEKASGKVKDPELKAWIDKQLPALREHLAMAEQLRGGKNDAAAMGHRGAKPDLGTATPKGAVTGTNTGNKTGS